MRCDGAEPQLARYVASGARPAPARRQPLEGAARRMPILPLGCRRGRPAQGSGDGMSDAIADEQAPAVIDQSQAVTFAIPLEEFRANLDAIARVVREYLIENEDYGKIPGTPKPTLLKPGAEKLCDLYGFSQTFEVTHRVEEWSRPSLTGEGTFPFIHYEVRCDLLRRSDGRLVSSGVGSCNSMEAKYRWRDDKLRCPECGMELRRSKQAAEFYCWAAKGGCGAKYPLSLAEGKVLGKVENTDVADQVNTILKMASKRALIDATLHATRSSGLLTQDIEDGAPADVVEGSYRDIDADALAPPANGKPKTAPRAQAAIPATTESPTAPPMSQPQKEYLFGGGKTPLDQALAPKWLIKVGGIQGAAKLMEANEMPAAVVDVIKYTADGRLVWAGNISMVQAKALIECLKEELGVKERGDATARSAFWAKCNELGVDHDNAHMFFRVPIDEGELSKYVQAKAKRLKTTQTAVWGMMRTQIEQAVEHDTLRNGAPDEPSTQAPKAQEAPDGDPGPTDIPFGE